MSPRTLWRGGLVSFSDAFFSGVLLGLDVNESFVLAKDAMRTYQDSLLDDNGDGIYEDGVDGAVAAGTAIGASFVAGKDIPQIGEMCGNQTLSSSITATLWVDSVVAVDPVERVWCLIVPPGHDPDPNNPVSDLPELELKYVGGGRYEAQYSGFSQHGAYKVIAYAKDIWGSVSLPRQSFVTQTGFDERVVLVAGGETNAPGWAAINKMANLGYHTFKGRWFKAENIYYLNANQAQDVDADGTNDVDALPSLANLGMAVTNWAAGANKLTVYLVGDSVGNALVLNSNETLSAAMLDDWLDMFQASDAQATVVLEFGGSGSYLPALKAPPVAERITVCSARPDQISCRSNGGMVSFCQYFLSDVFSGISIGNAYRNARDAISRASGPIRQQPLLDDDGDGVSSKSDGKLAESRYIGTAFMTGAETPLIGMVMSNAVFYGDAITLWVSDVTDMDGISNVWCVITRADYDGISDLPATNLTWNAASNRYEASFAGFSITGTNVCTFHAIDGAGEVSAPVQCEVVGLGDGYELDNSSTQAVAYVFGSPQARNFHEADDVDWVKFFAVSNFVYTIETIHIGDGVDTVLDIYRELADGSLSHVEQVDNNADGLGEGESTGLDHPESGMYYVRASHFNADEWGVGSEYKLKIWLEVGGGDLMVIAADKLNPGRSPSGAVAIVDGIHTQPFSGALAVVFSDLVAGVHTVKVEVAEGYILETDPVAGNQIENLNSYLYGNPKAVTLADDVWQFASFQYIPIVRIEGQARDARTGAWVGDAKLSFTATSGGIAGAVYDGYPNHATYKRNWVSQADGRFPTNVILPAVKWDMAVMSSGYSNYMATAVVTTPVPGQTVDVATVLLSPVDVNGNGVSDAWEGSNPGSVLDGVTDSDGDGASDLEEYLCGTDPQNPQSALRMASPTNGTPSAVTLMWSVSPGRSYQIAGTDDIMARPWPVIAGPWTATNAQTTMQWTDGAAGGSHKFYRVEALTP